MRKTAARPRTGRTRRIVVWCTVVVVGYLGLTWWQVWHTGRADQARPADAIVVLGAAQYDGRPSPVLQARLDHAVELYRRRLAPLIWVTGGSRPGDRFTEAMAAAGYLHTKGVPDGVIKRETTGATSYESLAAGARFMRQQGARDVILVSDPFHSYRIRDIAQEVGLVGFVSPTPSSPITGTARYRQLVRETMAVSVGRIMGYRRLERLGLALHNADVPGL